MKSVLLIGGVARGARTNSSQFDQGAFDEMLQSVRINRKK